VGEPLLDTDFKAGRIVPRETAVLRTNAHSLGTDVFLPNLALLLRSSSMKSMSYTCNSGNSHSRPSPHFSMLSLFPFLRFSASAHNPHASGLHAADICFSTPKCRHCSTSRPRHQPTLLLIILILPILPLPRHIPLARAFSAFKVTLTATIDSNSAYSSPDCSVPSDVGVLACRRRARRGRV